MSRAAANTPAIIKGHRKTLRSRLLVRLFGLLAILAISSLLFIVSRPETENPANSTLMSVVLFITGAALVISILSLVQNQLLDP